MSWLHLQEHDQGYLLLILFDAEVFVVELPHLIALIALNLEAQ